MFTEEEITAAVEFHAPDVGINVIVDTIHLPTYETHEGKLVRDKDGQFVARCDADGEHIHHLKPRAHLAFGRATITIDIERGISESPHEHSRLTSEEMSEIVKVQIGNLLKEATLKPLTVAEHATWQQDQARIAALLATAAREKHADELRERMTSPDIRAADYLAKYGESDFAVHAQYVGDYKTNLAHAVKLGALSAETAATETARIEAWKLRCEQRKADLVIENTNAAQEGA